MHNIDKIRLKAFRSQAREMQLLLETIAAMRATVGAKITNANGDIGGGGQPDGTDTERTVEKIIALEQKYNSKRRSYVEERLIIEDALNILEPNERALIRLYYFDLHTWEETAERLHYSYQHIHRLHASALSKLKGESGECSSSSEL